MQLRLVISASMLLAATLSVPAIACIGLARSEGAAPAQVKSARKAPEPTRPRPRGPVAPAKPLPSGLLPSGFLPSGFLPSGDLPSGDLPSGGTPSGQFPSGGWSHGLAGGLPGERPVSGMLQPEEWHAPILSPQAAADMGGYSVGRSPGDRPVEQAPSEEPEIDTTYYEYRGFVPAW